MKKIYDLIIKNSAGNLRVEAFDAGLFEQHDKMVGVARETISFEAPMCVYRIIADDYNRPVWKPVFDGFLAAAQKKQSMAD